MTCKHCGKEIEEHSTVCPHCGAEIEQVETVEAETAVPEKKRKPMLVPVLAIVLGLCIAAAAIYLFVLRDSGDGSVTVEPQQTVSDEAYRKDGEAFTEAVLLGNVDVICEATHPKLRDAFRAIFSKTNFVFEKCSIENSITKRILRRDIGAYENGLSEDYGIAAHIEKAYEVDVAFKATYNGKEYNGEIAVLVAEVDGGRYVLQAYLADMDEAFYEDNFTQGDYYFDTHGEE